MPKDARQVTDFIPATSGTTEGAGPHPGPDEQSERTRPEPTKHELTKVSANFVPRAVQALELASALTGDSRTDVLNRAVQMYAYLAKMMEEGNLVFVENPTTHAKERIVFL
jgi:hypothetical protein